MVGVRGVAPEGARPELVNMRYLELVCSLAQMQHQGPPTL